MSERAEGAAADTWLALVAGGAPWLLEATPPPPEVRLLAVVEAVGLGWVCAIVWAATLNHADDVGDNVPAMVAMVAIAVLGVVVVRTATGRPPLTRRLSANAAIRVTAMAVTPVALFSVTSGWRNLFIAALAIPGSADIALTLHDLGWKPTPARWWRGWLRSSLHFGVLGAVLASATIGGTSWVEALWVLAAVELTAAMTVAGASVCSRLIDEAETSREDAKAEARAEERRRRAHWLHDDVCAELRLVSLRVHAEQPSPTETTRLLDELDHSLRLRQLDELVEAGTVRAAEVIQPYIRRLQSRGIELTTVPSFDEAAMSLHPDAARHLARCASVLTSNALDAGATQVAIGLARTAAGLVLTVEDDGPGFTDPSPTPGRALWQVDLDLRPGGISIDSAPGRGAVVTATIPLAAEGTG